MMGLKYVCVENTTHYGITTNENLKENIVKFVKHSRQISCRLTKVVHICISYLRKVIFLATGHLLRPQHVLKKSRSGETQYI